MKAAEILKLAIQCGITQNWAMGGKYTLVATEDQLEKLAEMLVAPVSNELLRYQLLEIIKRDGLFSYELAQFMVNKGLAEHSGGDDYCWKPDVLDRMPVEQLVELTNQMQEVFNEQRAAKPDGC